MDSSKRSSDFNKGKFSREKKTTYLNHCFQLVNSGLRLDPISPYKKTMKIQEKVKNNKAKNHLTPTAQHRAMALYYHLSLLNYLDSIPFILMYKNKGGFYLKVPSEYKNNPEGYLKMLVGLNFHVLITEEESNQFGGPISIQSILQHWKWEMATSKGNKNRLQFYGKVSKISLLPPLQKDVFGSDLIDKLLKLFV